MRRSPVDFLRRAAAPLAVGALLCASACQDLNSYVTGEPFLDAPEGAPRVEVELVVDVEDSFLGSLDAGDELSGAVADLALELADVGMRFYPVPSGNYDSDAARPPYVMTIRVQDLEVVIDDELVEEEGMKPRIESSVEGVKCAVVSSVDHRRKGAPSLLVGQSRGTGHVRSSHRPEDQTGHTTYTVTLQQRDTEGLTVEREDVLSVVEKAMVRSLRDLVESVDREFSLPGAREGVEGTSDAKP